MSNGIGSRLAGEPALEGTYAALTDVLFKVCRTSRKALLAA
jgi:hypothetical protein